MAFKAVWQQQFKLSANVYGSIYVQREPHIVLVYACTKRPNNWTMCANEWFIVKTAWSSKWRINVNFNSSIVFFCLLLSIPSSSCYFCHLLLAPMKFPFFAMYNTLTWQRTHTHAASFWLAKRFIYVIAKALNFCVELTTTRLTHKNRWCS